MFSKMFIYNFIGIMLLFISSTAQIKEVLKMDDQIQKLAKELYQQKSLLVMGRGYNYATCLEGALVRLLLMYLFD